jgi:hypothetical protein
MATLSAQRKHKVTVVGSGNWYVAASFIPFGGFLRQAAREKDEL